MRLIPLNIGQTYNYYSHRLKKNRAVPRPINDKIYMVENKWYGHFNGLRIEQIKNTLIEYLYRGQKQKISFYDFGLWKDFYRWDREQDRTLGISIDILELDINIEMIALTSSSKFDRAIFAVIAFDEESNNLFNLIFGNYRFKKERLE